MQRRRALTTITASALLLGAPHVRRAEAQRGEGGVFSEATVRSLARDLAQRPFREPDATLPRSLANLGYDEYRALRFDPQRALWRDLNLGFQVQLFHRGFLFKHRVELFEITDRRAHPIVYDATAFALGDRERPDANFGHAGFRIHFALNQPDLFDEICSFLGASYFRAVGKNVTYGLSARGLAIKTADPGGEEFPLFRAFWLERPHAGANSVVVHALLDSPSATASFRFTIRPGERTVFDVQSTIFPRVELVATGIAPLTSMFYFAPNDRDGIDDYRPAVHDSDGLMAISSRGEQIWRPLSNPRNLQVSVFREVNPRGFGLMQRRREFRDYNDLEAHYEKRTSLWVEPIADWGEGAIQLIEIPTDSEIHDNIVAFWRPAQPMLAAGEYHFVYRLHWLPVVASHEDLAQFTSTRVGAASQGARLFVLDVAGGKLAERPAGTPPGLEVTTDNGEIRHPVVLANTEAGGWRIHFELVPGNAPLVELRVLLKDGDQPLTETWLYRWTA